MKRVKARKVGKSTPPPLVQQNGTSRVQSGCFVVSVFLGPVSIGVGGLGQPDYLAVRAIQRTLTDLGVSDLQYRGKIERV